MLFPAPIPPPIRRRTGLLSLCATGAITSVHRESSFAIIPIAFSSSTNVENTLATFKFFVTLSNLCSLYQQKTQGYLNNLILQKQYTCVSNNYNIQLSAIFFFLANWILLNCQVTLTTWGDVYVENSWVIQFKCKLSASSICSLIAFLWS